MQQKVKDRGYELSRLFYPRFAHNLQHQLKPVRSASGDLLQPGFERGKAALIEDRRRVRSLDRWAKQADAAAAPSLADGVTPAYATELALRLDSVTERRRPDQTFASAAYTRRYRLRFVGAALSLAAEYSLEELRLVTIVPPSWRLPGHALPALEPRQLLERFRQQLVRAGLKQADGWMIAFLHGDYDPTHDAYQPHLHILMTASLVPVLSQLAELPALRPGDPSQPGYVRSPVRIQRLSDPVRQISYFIAQGFWPAKASYWKDGVWRRSSYRGRIRAPRFTEYLMWLDRLSFRDLVLLKGCRIRGGRLRTT